MRRILLPIVLGLAAVVGLGDANRRQATKAAGLSASARGQRAVPIVQVFPALTGGTFSPDGRYVVCESEDARLRTFDLVTGLCVRVWRGESPQFSADGRVLVFQRDDKLLARDFASGRDLHTIAGGRSRFLAVGLSQDGRLLATLAPRIRPTNGELGDEVRIWDIATGQVRNRIHLRRKDITLHDAISPPPNPVFSSDGRWLYLNHPRLVCLDVQTGKRRDLGSSLPPDRTIVVGRQPPYLVTRSRDWSRRTETRSSQSDATYEIRSLDSGRPLATLQAEDDPSFEEALVEYPQVKFSPDLALYAVPAPGRAAIKRVRNGEQVAMIGPLHHKLEFEVFDFSPDGKSVLCHSPEGPYVGETRLSARTGALAVVDACTGEVIRQVQSRARPIRSLTLTADGRNLFACDGDFHWWDLRQGARKQRFTNSNGTLSMAADSKTLLVGHSLLDMTRADFLEPLAHQMTNCTLKDFSKNEWSEAAEVRAMSSDKGLFLAERQEVVSVLDRSGRTLRTLGETQPYWTQEGAGSMGDPGVVALFFSPDDRLAIVAGARVGLRVWRLRDGRSICQDEHGLGDAEGKICVSPDSRYVAVSGVPLFGEAWLNVVDLASRKKTLVAEEEADAMCFCDARNALFYIEGDQLTGWNTRTRRFVVSVQDGLLADSTALAFHPSGRILFVGYSDGSCRLFDARDLRKGRIAELARCVAFEDGDWLVITPHGRYDSNNPDKLRGLVWILPDQPLRPKLAGLLKEGSFRPGLLADLVGSR